MVCVLDTFLGLLLGLSVFLLALSVLAYTRSGVRTFLFMSEGLAVHVVFTGILLFSACLTSWPADVNNWIPVVVDAVLLVVIIAMAYLGGRPSARRS